MNNRQFTKQENYNKTRKEFTSALDGLFKGDHTPTLKTETKKNEVNRILSLIDTNKAQLTQEDANQVAQILTDIMNGKSYIEDSHSLLSKKIYDKLSSHYHHTPFGTQANLDYKKNIEETFSSCLTSLGKHTATVIVLESFEHAMVAKKVQLAQKINASASENEFEQSVLQFRIDQLQNIIINLKNDDYTPDQADEDLRKTHADEAITEDFITVGTAIKFNAELYREKLQAYIGQLEEAVNKEAVLSLEEHIERKIAKLNKATAKAQIALVDKILDMKNGILLDVEKFAELDVIITDIKKVYPNFDANEKTKDVELEEVLSEYTKKNSGYDFDILRKISGDITKSINELDAFFKENLLPVDKVSLKDTLSNTVNELKQEIINLINASYTRDAIVTTQNKLINTHRELKSLAEQHLENCQKYINGCKEREAEIKNMKETTDKLASKYVSFKRKSPVVTEEPSLLNLVVSVFSSTSSGEGSPRSTSNSSSSSSSSQNSVPVATGKRMEILKFDIEFISNAGELLKYIEGALNSLKFKTKNSLRKEPEGIRKMRDLLKNTKLEDAQLKVEKLCAIASERLQKGKGFMYLFFNVDVDAGNRLAGTEKFYKELQNLGSMIEKVRLKTDVEAQKTAIAEFISNNKLDVPVPAQNQPGNRA